MASGFIPLGAQYYRVPTPAPGEWEKDLITMREYGFNTIKIWAVWRYNNPGYGVYRFDDIDTLMDLAEANGLKVIINVIFDSAPVWVYRKYPDCRMKTLSGREIGPMTTSARQIGGVPGPCLNHGGANEALMEFLKATVQRYSSHPALLAWDLWNEPELDGGIADVRDVGWGRSGEISDLLCYCDSCRARFIDWLKAKYIDIEALNAKWKRYYDSWDEVEIPISPSVYTDMIDWRLFFVDTLGGEIRKRVDVTKELDPSHPAMCHSVPRPVFNIISTASDEWVLAEPCDLFGNSLGSSPFAADWTRSASNGKTVWNAEIHAYGGSTLCRPAIITFEELKRHIITPLACGIKGFVFWQYRPELLGNEAPAWGLTFPDGRPAQQLEDVSRLFKLISENAQFISEAEREHAKTAIVYSPMGEIFSWCAGGSVSLCNDSLSGVYKALYDANHIVNFVNARFANEQDLTRYEVLYIPFAYCLEPDFCRILREWVKNGGTLISEAFFSAQDSEKGLHSDITPGCGFDEVFGLREGIVYPLERKPGKPVNINLLQDLGRCPAGSCYRATHSAETFYSIGAEVIGVFETGEPAITVNSYGKGSAIMVGTLLGLGLARTQDSSIGDLIASLVETRRPRADLPTVTGGGPVRIDILADGSGKEWMILQNNSGRDVSGILSLPGYEWTVSESLFDRETLSFTQDGRASAAAVTLSPGEIKIFAKR